MSVNCIFLKHGERKEEAEGGPTELLAGCARAYHGKTKPTHHCAGSRCLFHNNIFLRGNGENHPNHSP